MSQSGKRAAAITALYSRFVRGNYFRPVVFRPGRVGNEHLQELYDEVLKLVHPTPGPDWVIGGEGRQRAIELLEIWLNVKPEDQK